MTKYIAPDLPDRFWLEDEEGSQYGTYDPYGLWPDMEEEGAWVLHPPTPSIPLRVKRQEGNLLYTDRGVIKIHPI